MRQELFVPFINSTESSEFYILYNYASSANAFGETSATNWIHKEAEMRHPLDNLGDDARWVVFNIQQTGKRTDQFLKLKFSASTFQATIALIMTIEIGSQ